MTNKEKQAENKEKIGIGAWLALIVLILVLSGALRTAEGPIKVLECAVRCIPHGGGSNQGA